MHKRAHLFKWMVGLIFFVLLSSTAACQRATPSPAPTSTPTPAQSPTPYPTRTPTPYPLASQENPLVLGIVSDTGDAAMTSAADQLVQIVARITDYHIQTRVYPSYAALTADLNTGKVHIAFLQPFTYLWAREKNLVEPGLLTNHFGVYQYGAQILANVASNFTIYYDPSKGLNTTNAAIALQQFANKRPCWVDQTSASGYVVPLGLLSEEGIQVKPGVIAQSHTSVVRALYITGICDFGATFATTGDPRTASVVTQDLTDVMNRVVVIYQIDPIIPNLVIAYHSSLPKDMRSDLTFALQSIFKDPQQQVLFTNATNYEIAALMPVDDSLYDPLRTLLKFSGVNLDSLIGN